jgi:hypothetical protein
VADREGRWREGLVQNVELEIPVGRPLSVILIALRRFNQHEK